MTQYALWFIMALVLLGLEMATGTFYILVIALAACIGGVAALAGAEPYLQFAVSGVASIAGIALLRRTKKAHPGAAGMDLDIGQRVHVVSWGPNGTARVLYRGAEWDAEPESPDTPRDVALYIKALHGSKLILTQLKPKP